jgi:hypothetical protein
MGRFFKLYFRTPDPNLEFDTTDGSCLLRRSNKSLVNFGSQFGREIFNDQEIDKQFSRLLTTIDQSVNLLQMLVAFLCGEL